MACSTPNGIKGTYTNDHVCDLVLTGKCSTPNGIKGTYTDYSAFTEDGQSWCSTPNGIKGTYTAAIPPFLFAQNVLNA